MQGALDEQERLPMEAAFFFVKSQQAGAGKTCCSAGIYSRALTEALVWLNPTQRLQWTLLTLKRAETHLPIHEDLTVGFCQERGCWRGILCSRSAGATGLNGYLLLFCCIDGSEQNLQKTSQVVFTFYFIARHQSGDPVNAWESF